MKKLGILSLVFLAILLLIFFKPRSLSEEELGGGEALAPESFLRGVQSVKTQWPEGADFEVEMRTHQMETQDCAQCHKGARVQRRGELKNRRAHWKIQMRHANSQTMNCKTCHSSSDVSRLTLLGGETLSMNHAYQTCKQCHFEQARDWAGGAHGKRVKTWTGQRVILNCTACHNPHRPQWGKRWPKVNVNLPEGH